MRPKSLAPVLEGHPFLEGMEKKHIDLIVGCAKNVRFNAGDYIFREGEAANDFYIIRRGLVSVELYSPRKGPISIQTLRDGDILGWSWLIPPHQWRFDARAVETTRAIALDGGCLRGKLEDDHGLGYQLLKRFSRVMAKTLEGTRLQLLDLYGEGA
ncbi:MAG: cyclic nucleotide-binding domain-containing protein [Candidatus Nitrospinota bacterium M3_3B_026]